MSDYKDLTEDDFTEAKPAPAPAGTNPATGKAFTNPEVMRELLGPPSAASAIEPSWLKRGLAGAGMSMVNKARGIRGEPSVEGYGLAEDTAGSIGALLPEVAGSMLAPARVLPQAAYGAVSRGIEPAPNVLERGVNALKGAAEFGGGQAATQGLVRGINAATGNLTREGQVASAAGQQGLKLSAGDIMDSNILRELEKRSIKSPSAGQAEQVAALMADPKNNPLVNAVQNAYQTAQGKVSEAATRLDDLVAQGGLPKVTPRNTYDALRQIGTRSPKTLDAIGDPVLRQRVEEIIATPAGRIPKGMGFSELDELRKVFGPIMSKVEMQSRSGASNINAADANRWKQLYKGIMDDIDSWGVKGAAEDARAAHKELSETFKNEVLPLREHPVAGKVLSGGYERPEDLVRDLALAQRNSSVNKQLYDRLDIGGKNALDAFRMAKRGSKEFVRGDQDSGWVKPLALSAGLTAPAWAPAAGGVLPWLAGGLAAEQALVHGLNTPIGRAIAGGSPQAAKSPLANAAIQSGLRVALPQGALETYRR